MTNHLLSLGRPAILNESQRSSVRAIVAEADRLRHKVTGSGLGCEYRAKGAAEMAMATLLLDYPALADEFADEVSAAHPGRQKFGPPVSHRMLGPAYSIQGGTMDGPDPILLLQLDSGQLGPRLNGTVAT